MLLFFIFLIYIPYFRDLRDLRDLLFLDLVFFSAVATFDFRDLRLAAPPANEPFLDLCDLLE